MASRKSKRKAEAAGGRSPAPPSGTPGHEVEDPGGRRFRGWRGWILRLSMLVLSPVLLFGLLELGLRAGGYGYPTGFFIKTDTPGVWRTNERFAWQFFPRAMRFFPRATVLEPVRRLISGKPAGTVRIFILGSSAAMGVPDPAYSFGRILEIMLRDRYPGRPFEVVNAAFSATNSHVALEIARDCAAFEPDLFIVYAGNNEVVGPYGPGAVFQSCLPSLWMIRARGRVAATRVGQLLADIAGYFRRGGKEPSQWRAMAAMFMDNPVAADDPRLARTYDNFRENLTDICRVGRSAGAAVVLSTVAVNLEDFPPVVSRHRADLSPEDLGRWQALYKEGAAMESAGKGPEAIEKFLAAERIDDRYAELQYRLGRCLAAAGDRAVAGDRFVRGRDLDVLRFRADTHINAAIRDVAAGARDGVYLADAEGALAACGIPDKDLFYEHVHLTFEGNYQLARAMLDRVCQALRERLVAPDETSTPSKARCAERLALTAWNELEMAERITTETSNPPFTSQLDHSLREAAGWERVNALRQLATTPEALQTAWKTYEAALAESNDDWLLREHFGSLAMRCGRPDEAARQWGIVVEKFPWALTLKLSLGAALLQAGKVDEAVGHLEQALRIKPDYADAHNNLGLALREQGKADEAIAHFRKALEISPRYAEAHNNLGLALLGQEKADEAAAHLQKALETNPDYPEALYNLGLAREQQGRTDDAIACYQNVLTVRPQFMQAALHLGSALAKQQRIDEAVATFQKILETNPQSVETHYGLGFFLRQQGKTAEALAHWREGLRLSPDNVLLLNGTAWLLATSPDASARNGKEAVELAKKAVQLSGGKDPMLLDTLAAAYAEAGQFPQAIQTAEQAMALATSQKVPDEDIRRRLALYKSGQACRGNPPAPAANGNPP